MQLAQMNIAFIGGGNMAQALVGGLVANGFSTKKIWVAEPHSALYPIFESQNVAVTPHNDAAVKLADVVVLAVKPQVMRQVLTALGSALAGKLIISIAAGVTIDTISGLLGGHERIVRAMPNTPALVQQGATGLYANAAVLQADREVAAAILNVAGLVVWVKEEALLHAVTAVSGSGPAYFFYLMEAMMKAGEALGLDAMTSRTLTLQTALGAADMATKSRDTPATLREKVTSPGGTTAAAVTYMDEQQMAHIIDMAVKAAAKRSEELARGEL